MVSALGLAEEVAWVRNDSAFLWHLVPLSGSDQVRLSSGPDPGHLGPVRTVWVRRGMHVLTLQPREVLRLERDADPAAMEALTFGVYDHRLANPDGVSLTWTLQGDALPGGTLALAALAPRPGRPAPGLPGTCADANHCHLTSPFYPAVPEPSQGLLEPDEAMPEASHLGLGSGLLPATGDGTSPHPWASPSSSAPLPDLHGPAPDGQDRLPGRRLEWEGGDEGAPAAGESGPPAKRARGDGAVPAGPSPEAGPVAAPARLQAFEHTAGSIRKGSLPGLVLANTSAETQVTLILFPAHPPLRAQAMDGQGRTSDTLTIPAEEPTMLKVLPLGRLLLVPTPHAADFGLTFELICVSSGPHQRTGLHYVQFATPRGPDRFLQVFTPNGILRGPEHLPATLRWDQGGELRYCPGP